jgi:DNA transposition AAA+ family ATPase
MNADFKQKVSDRLNTWLQESPENRSLNGLAEEHSIPKLYVSKIKNGIFEVYNNTTQKSTVIADEYFYRIAEAIGMMARSGSGLHWETFNFQQVQLISKRAQRKKMRVLLEGDTGSGKTYGLEHYQIHVDKVIYIKATRSMTERNLLQAILKKLSIRDDIRGARNMINAIRHTLTGTPGYLLIIDEAEYLKNNLFHVIKEIADFTEGKCGFILSGLGISSIIKRHSERKRMGFPQLRRRFFPNRVVLPDRIERSEKEKICMDSGITDKTAINVISQICNDFDMLSQVVSEVISWQKSSNRKVNGAEIMSKFKDTIEI